LCSKIIFIIICQIVPLVSGELVLPDHINEEWILQEPVRIFSEADLFAHINGGAELFLEFGFEDLRISKYSKDSSSLDLEVYKMENEFSALGIYLSKTGRESPLKEISARNTANPYQILLTRGRFFIMVNNFSGQEKLISLMIYLSQILANQIDESDSINLFSYLPIENLVEGSQVIFRGPFGLQSIFTFGKGDVLLLGGNNFGVSANYRLEDNKNMSRLVIPYPDNTMAIKAYNNLVLNLDSYLEIVNRSENQFVFTDYKNEYGVVKIDKNFLKIKIHLPSKP